MCVIGISPNRSGKPPSNRKRLAHKHSSNINGMNLLCGHCRFHKANTRTFGQLNNVASLLAAQFIRIRLCGLYAQCRSTIPMNIDGWIVQKNSWDKINLRFFSRTFEQIIRTEEHGETSLKEASRGWEQINHEAIPFSDVLVPRAEARCKLLDALVPERADHMPLHGPTQWDSTVTNDIARIPSFCNRDTNTVLWILSFKAMRLFVIRKRCIQ